MSAKLSDGMIIDTTDINRLLAIVNERSQGRSLVPEINSEVATTKPIQMIDIRVTEIRSNDGVTIKVGNLEAKKTGFEDKGSVSATLNLAAGNFIEVKHKCKCGNYLIRVWRYETAFGCNCTESDRVRYMEFPFGEYKDENAVFKFVQDWLNKGGMNQQ